MNNMTSIWTRYATAQGYAAMLPGRASGASEALQMAASVVGLTGSGVVLGKAPVDSASSLVEVEGYECSAFEF